MGVLSNVLSNFSRNTKNMYCTSSKTNSRSLFLPRTVRFFLNVSLVFLSLYMCGNFSQRNTHTVVEWLHVCLPLYLYAYSKIRIELKYSAESATQKYSDTFFVFRIIRCLGESIGQVNEKWSCWKQIRG